MPNEQPVARKKPVVNPTAPIPPSAGPAPPRLRRTSRRLFDVWSVLLLVGFYALGVLHWVYFYRGGDFSLRQDD